MVRLDADRGHCDGGELHFRRRRRIGQESAWSVVVRFEGAGFDEKDSNRLRPRNIRNEQNIKAPDEATAKRANRIGKVEAGVSIASR